MFSTRKRCLIRIPIWGYQNFYSLPPKNWILGPKTAKFGPKLAFWAKYRHFCPIWSKAWPKNDANKLSRWFSVMLVPKLLLTPIKIRLFGPKTAKFGPKYAFLVILGQILPFLHILSNARPKNNVNKVPRWVFRYVGNKTFDFSSKKKDFLPKNDQIWPKIGIFGQLGQAVQAYSMPCWWVGWWLWRAGCISQDTYLLYGKSIEGQLTHTWNDNSFAILTITF